MADDLEKGFAASAKRAQAKNETRKTRRTEKVHRARLEFVPAYDFEASMDVAAAAYGVQARKIEARFSERVKGMNTRQLTVKQLTAKVRGEIAAGKVPKGNLKKTVEARRKRNDRDHRRKLRTLDTEKQGQLNTLREKIFPGGQPSGAYLVRQAAWDYTVQATVEISNDTREISVQFTANAGDDLEALVFLAADDYFQDDRIAVLSFEVTAQMPATESSEA